MRKPFTLVMALAGAMLLMPLLTGAAEKLPPPDAHSLWSYMTQTHPYQKWSYWPGHEGIYPGKSPHGKYLKLYVNDIALKAARSHKPMPDGAIIVKENYGKDKKTLMAITPMYRVKGYNPSAGDWFWVKYKPNGKAMASGKVQSCIKCHSVRKNHDWLFSVPK